MIQSEDERPELDSELFSLNYTILQAILRSTPTRNTTPFEEYSHQCDTANATRPSFSPDMIRGLEVRDSNQSDVAVRRLGPAILFLTSSLPFQTTTGKHILSVTSGRHGFAPPPRCLANT